MEVESPLLPFTLQNSVPQIPIEDENLEIEEVKSIKHTGLAGSFQLLKLPSNKKKYRYSNQDNSEAVQSTQDVCMISEDADAASWSNLFDTSSGNIDEE